MYEATPVYSGRAFLIERHLARLQTGLDAISIDFDTSPLAEVGEELVARNEIEDAEFAVFYVQVTRGAAPRTHAVSDPARLADGICVREAAPASDPRGLGPRVHGDYRPRPALVARGHQGDCSASERSGANKPAVEAGVTDAIFIREGMAMEGTHNNVFAVLGGVVATAPATHHILHGVTRKFLLEVADELGLPVQERSVSLDELYAADEVFFTGTTTEVRPTVSIDGQRIGDGVPGPITRRLWEAYLEAVAP